MRKSRASKVFDMLLALSLIFSAGFPVFAAGEPKTAQDFALQYMDAFNKKDSKALNKLRFKANTSSPMQELIDEITEAEMKSGTQYNKFQILPVEGKKVEAQMGPDGLFYKPNLTPTNMLKLISETKDGTASTTFPIGVKDGIFYQVTVVQAEGEAPPYKFGWQRFTAPKSTWSVLMPNEPEPGRAALEKELGKDPSLDEDAYGVVKNTAAIKTTQHFFQCGAEGKRVHAKDNKDTFRVKCTTYDPETLKEWFSDPKKNLDDTVDYRIRTMPGKLVQKKDIELAGAPGREFEIKAEDGTFCLGRAYWIKDALYELTFESTSDKADVASANKFLNSLEVK